MVAKHFKCIQFRNFIKKKKQKEETKSHWISIFLLLIKVTVIKYVTETLSSLLYAEICDIQVSMSCFDQILGKRESQTQQVFNPVGISFCDCVVLTLFMGTKLCENVQKSQKLQNFYC